MTNEKSICSKCRKENGFKPRDSGFHTARKKECDGCGNIEGILPSRHWVKDNGGIK